jgi:hypothetical protein
MKRSERIAITDRLSQAKQQRVKEVLTGYLRNNIKQGNIHMFLEEFKKFILNPIMYQGEMATELRELYNTMYNQTDTSRSPQQRALLIVATINAQLTANRDAYTKSQNREF